MKVYYTRLAVVDSCGIGALLACNPGRPPPPPPPCSPEASDETGCGVLAERGGETRASMLERIALVSLATLSLT